MSKLGLTRNRPWRGSETRRCPPPYLSREVRIDKVSLPFWFLSKGKTSFVRDRELLWEVFEKSSFKVTTAVSAFAVQQDPKLRYRHRG